jgi:hypothetical protein
MNAKLQTGLRNAGALLMGLLVGAMVNGWIIQISGSIIAPPEGADLTTEEGLREAMSRFEFRHFVMPFLAHALGTLVGAVIASYIAVSYRILWSLIIGALFFIGGAMMVAMLPSPIWFNVVDLLIAYFPMAWLGWKLTGRPLLKSA